MHSGEIQQQNPRNQASYRPIPTKKRVSDEELQRIHTILNPEVTPSNGVFIRDEQDGGGEFTPEAIQFGQSPFEALEQQRIQAYRRSYHKLLTRGRHSLSEESMRTEAERIESGPSKNGQEKIIEREATGASINSLVGDALAASIVPNAETLDRMLLEAPQSTYRSDEVFLAMMEQRVDGLSVIEALAKLAEANLDLSAEAAALHRELMQLKHKIEKQSRPAPQNLNNADSSGESTPDSALEKAPSSPVIGSLAQIFKDKEGPEGNIGRVLAAFDASYDPESILSDSQLIALLETTEMTIHSKEGKEKTMSLLEVLRNIAYNEKVRASDQIRIECRSILDELRNMRARIQRRKVA